MITMSDIPRLNRLAHEKSIIARVEKMTDDEFWEWAETALTEDEGIAMLVTMKQMQDAK